MSSSGMMPPAEDQDVVEARSRSSVDDLREQRHVRAREHRQTDGVGVLLQRRLRHLLGRLVQAGVDDLEPGVAQRPCDHLGAPIVSVEPGLGDDDAVAPLHAVLPMAPHGTARSPSRSGSSGLRLETPIRGQRSLGGRAAPIGATPVC